MKFHYDVDVEVPDKEFVDTTEDVWWTNNTTIMHAVREAIVYLYGKPYVKIDIGYRKG